MLNRQLVYRQIKGIICNIRLCPHTWVRYAPCVCITSNTFTHTHIPTGNLFKWAVCCKALMWVRTHTHTLTHSIYRCVCVQSPLPLPRHPTAFSNLIRWFVHKQRWLNKSLFSIDNWTYLAHYLIWNTVPAVVEWTESVLWRQGHHHQVVTGSRCVQENHHGSYGCCLAHWCTLEQQVLC